MPKLAFVVVLSAFGNGQVEPNYGLQSNQYNGSFYQEGQQYYGPWGSPNGHVPGAGFESWDWRTDPFARAQAQVSPL